MRKALIARGVPAEKITLDYAGLRTLIQLFEKEIFGQNKLIIITIISQLPRPVHLRLFRYGCHCHER